MEEVYVFEGKTSTEAIEKGLKELNVSKSKVDIKILESEEKRSFFSILTPRVVKVEMRLKEEVKELKTEKKKQDISRENINTEEFVKNIEKFLSEFIQTLPTEDLKYKVEDKESIIYVDIDGEDTGYLIGYRGEVLNSIQTIISNIASKTSKEKVRVVVNIGGYREKREKDLQNLANKIAGTVI